MTISSARPLCDAVAATAAGCMRNGAEVYTWFLRHSHAADRPRIVVGQLLHIAKNVPSD